MPFFSSLKESTVLIKIIKYKMGVTVLVFAVELQKVRTKCIFSDFWERMGKFQNGMHEEGRRKH